MYSKTSPFRDGTRTSKSGGGTAQVTSNLLAPAKEKKWTARPRRFEKQEHELSGVTAWTLKKSISLFMAVVNGNVPVLQGQVRLYISGPFKSLKGIPLVDFPRRLCHRA